MPSSVRRKRICVYCGSRVGRAPSFARCADEFGHAIGLAGLELVYGGVNAGLMGRIADAALESGAHVIGIIPEAMAESELAYRRLPELRIVSSMHERKAAMEALADAFVALPGGMGTLEEFAEVFTWFQLGLHKKPCGLLNVDGYFTPLLEFVRNATDQEFVSPDHGSALIVEHEPSVLLRRLLAHESFDRAD